MLFLSDILPTGDFGADIANVQPGDDIAVFGVRPVGYFATMNSFLRGVLEFSQLTTGRLV